MTFAEVDKYIDSIRLISTRELMRKYEAKYAILRLKNAVVQKTSGNSMIRHQEWTHGRMINPDIPKSRSMILSAIRDVMYKTVRINNVMKTHGPQWSEDVPQN